MKPGPELDRIVHKHGMGGVGKAPPYSTDIAWAWKVVEKHYEGGEVFNVARELDDEYIVGISHWTGNRRREDGSWVKIWDDTKWEPTYKCPTLPHAICIASVALYLDDNGEEYEYEPEEMERLREVLEKNGSPLERPERNPPWGVRTRIG